MKNKKTAYFDNHTQSIQVRDLTRVESIKRYFNKAFKKSSTQSF